ncbi:MAG: hypothetical protein V4487_07900 [Chlamydiota bacterium]
MDIPVYETRKRFLFTGNEAEVVSSAEKNIRVNAVNSIANECLPKIDEIPTVYTREGTKNFIERFVSDSKIGASVGPTFKKYLAKIEVTNRTVLEIMKISKNILKSILADNLIIKSERANQRYEYLSEKDLQEKKKQTNMKSEIGENGTKYFMYDAPNL